MVVVVVVVTDHCCLIYHQQTVKKSSHVARKLAKRKVEVEQGLEEQFAAGRLLAAITSRPGQSGRADGYILEGKELEFYHKQLAKKRGKKA